AISNLLRNRRLSRAIADASWGSFAQMLGYKARWRGVELIIAPRGLASSKTCSSCGQRKDDLSLSDRTYRCEGCGVELDRDLNAAINLARHGRAMYQVAAGRAETLNAGGGESSGSAESSRFCETCPDEAGTDLVERSAGSGQPRRLP
ncbi:MAG: RNA-guided endonuclease InsQ/TnpB family protein, partial [Acidimicrobiia bacterium]